MLTVKHVRYGIETICEAPNGVQHTDPRVSPSATGEPIVGLCILGSAKGEIPLEGNWLMDGVAYVMNDAGQTVGVYRLPSSEPIEEAPPLTAG